MSNHRVSRRRFMRLATAGATAPLLWRAGEAYAQSPPPPSNVRIVRDAVTSGTFKTTLTPADLAYAGSFQLPVSTAAGADATWGKGLTHRYVNGQLRFMATAWRPDTLYEVEYPGLATIDAAATARIVKEWGDSSVWGALRSTDHNGLNTGTIEGIYWDAVDQRLYFGYGDIYNTTSPNDPSVGAAALNDSTGVAKSLGCWRVGPSCKYAMGGVTAVPEWWSQQFSPGQRLAAGFGGYWSIVTCGPASMGPALSTFAPPNLSSNPNASRLIATSLVNYPYSATPYTTPDRCHRADLNYTNDFDYWNPKNGIGYWSWSDWLYQGGVWIDTDTKSGFITFPTLGNGKTWYETSTLHATNASHWCFAYSPHDLAAAVAGLKQPWELQPSSQQVFKFPGLAYPLPGWQDEPWNMVTGVTYDSTTRTLYVAVRFASPGKNTVIHAYNVA